MNNIVHIEFGVADLAKAKKFYTTIFDWNIELSKEIPDYLFFTTDEDNQQLSGGISLVDEPSTGSVEIYIKVENIEDSMKIITENGGRIILEKTKLPGNNGFISRFEDPFGNIMGIWNDS